MLRGHSSHYVLKNFFMTSMSSGSNWGMARSSGYGRQPLLVPQFSSLTFSKHRNLFAHAPERLHDEITADYNDMIYATTPEEIETRRKAFIRKWRLKHRAVADSLEEAGERLFTFA